jgi:hypothetical protein
MRTLLRPLGPALGPALASLSLSPVAFATSQSPLALSLPNAWSVHAADLASPDLASSIFSLSLPSYLLMLFFLSRPQANTPKLANFGFQFLLVFVFATIPAGIYAKTHYHDILANVDWLHGLAESFLTITNLLIIAGFRSAQAPSSPPSQPSPAPMLDSALLITLVAIFNVYLSLSGQMGHLHTEPYNALSLPTWTVHVSSLLEWLLAMDVVWKHAETSGNPRWRGLAWAMLPSHASGLCACTYHLFFNSPQLLWLVTLQASLTTVGNSLMALAAYRIFAFGKNQQQQQLCAETNTSNPNCAATSDNNRESGWGGKVLYLNLAVKSLGLAWLVKEGELLLDFPFAPEGADLLALSCILAPSSFIALQLLQRSRQETRDSVIV